MTTASRLPGALADGPARQAMRTADEQSRQAMAAAQEAVHQAMAVLEAARAQLRQLDPLRPPPPDQATDTPATPGPRGQEPSP